MDLEKLNHLIISEKQTLQLLNFVDNIVDVRQDNNNPNLCIEELENSWKNFLIPYIICFDELSLQSIVHPKLIYIPIKKLVYRVSLYMED